MSETNPIHNYPIIDKVVDEELTEVQRLFKEIWEDYSDPEFYARKKMLKNREKYGREYA